MLIGTQGNRGIAQEFHLMFLDPIQIGLQAVLKLKYIHMERNSPREAGNLSKICVNIKLTYLGHPAHIELEIEGFLQVACQYSDPYPTP